MSPDPQLTSFAYALVFAAAIGGLVLMVVMPRQSEWGTKGRKLFALGVAGVVAFYVMGNQDFTEQAAGKVTMAAVGILILFLQLAGLFKK